MAEPAPTWFLDGDYFENCNCAVVCPCLVSSQAPLTAIPTEGVCDVAIAVHISQGMYGDVAINDLNAVLVAHTPGPMIDGNWTVALYLDERADDAQRAALQAILSGQAGGVMGGFAPLIGEVLGVKAVPIAFAIEGKRRSVEVPGLLSLNVRPVATLMGEDAEVLLANAHPFAPDSLGMAVGGEGSTCADYGLMWDNSGRNAHYATIHWSNG